ncbi:MAG: hypothetical protein AAGG68_12810 [Bacteroidota bacterium]
MPKLIVALLLLSFYSIISHGQKIVSDFENYHNAHHTEKIYISHDKDFYIPGDTIWGKVFLVDGRTHRAFDANPIVYVNWMSPSGEILDSYQLKIKEGTAPISIATNFNDTTGNYVLRAYTQYQRNFDSDYILQKSIPIINEIDFLAEKVKEDATDFSLQFFPEGGYLVEGLENTIAFKAQNSLGENIDIEGIVLKANKREVITFSTLHEGMGSFKLTANDFQEYEVLVKYKGIEKRFALPKALPKGYILNVNTIQKDQIVLTFQTNINLEGTQLIGQVRGQVFLNYEIEEKERKTLVLTKAEIPSGVLHLTLFDRQNRPVAERLIFNQNPKERVKAIINIPTDTIHKYQPITGSFSTLLANETIASQASMSIYNSDIIYEEISSLDIVNYLWLQSDLKGKVTNIHQYFKEDNVKTRTFLDLLLMTHAWRRFKWQEVLTRQYPNLDFPAEQSFTIAGKIKKYESDKPIKANVSLTVLDEEQFALMSLETDESGLFYFTGLEFPDTTNVLVKATKYDEKRQKKFKAGKTKSAGSSYVDIELFSLEEFPFEDSITYQGSIEVPSPTEKSNLNIQRIKQEKILQNDLWSIDLDGVTVRAKVNKATLRAEEAKERYREKGIFYFASTDKFLPDDPQYDGFKYNDIYDLILTVVPSVKIIREGGRKRVIYGSLSAGRSPIIALDGKAVSRDRISLIKSENIAVVEVLTGLYAQAVYGNPLVIALISRRGDEYTQPAPGSINLEHPGYYTAKTFYTPNYEKEKPAKADYRTTLYWNPMVKVENQAINFKCFAGDIAGEYTILIEGITETGLPFMSRKKIWITDH